MEPISIALGLAQFVPGLTKLLMGDKAGQVADKVVSVANVITGIDDPKKAVEHLQANPELQLKFQQEMNHIVIAELEAETRQLETINATMRVEVESNDPFVRRWRAFFGYVVAITWLIMMGSLGVVIVVSPNDAPSVINAMNNLAGIWSVALGVLGICVSKHSQDKQVAAGQTPTTIFSAIAQKIAPSKKAVS